MQKMKTSQEGKALIKKFEGCELKAYLCPAQVWTIGYGHTAGVSEGDVCTQEDADRMLAEDLEEFEGYVREAVDVPLEQNEFDALVAWTYNLGPGNLRSSTMLKKLNDSKFEEVPSEIRRWNKSGGEVLDGLVRRREAEALLFKGEEWGDV
ncbi:lysozyme [Phenylobacterium sp.]|uniref:lysozyme n=1 Tax=Phenylobacterium sp. TaxID=1871053 RepID=UPI0025D7E674|nr:lysozyme [Phenylobacterium sp.]